MDGDPLNQFQRDIAQYRAVWRSARVSGLAKRENGQWISLGVRLSLDIRPPRPLDIQAPYDWFMYFDGLCPVAHFDRLAEELVRGRYLTVQADYSATRGSYACIYLDRQAAQKRPVLSVEAFPEKVTLTVPSGPTWNYWGFQNRGDFQQNGTDRASYVLSASGERTIDILSGPDKQRIDSKLRAGDPVFDGLDVLIEKILPGLNSEIHQANAQFQVLAPLPFFLRSLDAGKIVVSAPASTPQGGLGLRFFFRPKGLEPSPLIGLRPEIAAPGNHGMVDWHLNITWPKEATIAKACLFFLDREIDSLTVSRWSAGPSLRLALDDYFDPERSKLVEGLGTNARRGAHKLDSRLFEAAIARLMGLLGVPLIWYGSTLAADARPDLGGLVVAAGKKVAVLAECTLSKPEHKFSELHKRADEVSAVLGAEAEVLAVVFTPAPTTTTEAERAAEHGVVLVGPDGLRELLGFLESPLDPAEVLAWLRQLRSIATRAFD